jgi:serine phosphatase RsbU (regulator of sigma subunit)
MNIKRQEYGDKRLQNFVKDHLNASPSSLIHSLVANVNEFTAGAPVKDDMTIIAIKVE